MLSNMVKTLYDVLEVSTDASAEDIRSAFKRLVKKYHPDVASIDKNEAGEIFKEIVRAYNVLSDRFERQSYDNDLRYGEFKIPDQPSYEWTYLPYLDSFGWVRKVKSVRTDHHDMIYR